MFMAMYMFHIAFALGLIALVMGLSMCKCCCKTACDTNAGKCCKCGKWIGIIITILALISLACTMNTGYKQMKLKDGIMTMMGMEMEKMKDMKDDMKDMKDDVKKDMDKKD
jgi:uncharacterized membrane protein